MKRCASACGDCRRCRLIDAKLRQAKKTASLLQQALLLLDVARWEIQHELDAAGADEVKQHPALRTKLGLIARIEKLTRQA